MAADRRVGEKAPRTGAAPEDLWDSETDNSKEYAEYLEEQGAKQAATDGLDPTAARSVAAEPAPPAGRSVFSVPAGGHFSIVDWVQHKTNQKDLTREGAKDYLTKKMTPKDLAELFSAIATHETDKMLAHMMGMEVLTRILLAKNIEGLTKADTFQIVGADGITRSYHLAATETYGGAFGIKGEMRVHAFHSDDGGPNIISLPATRNKGHQSYVFESLMGALDPRGTGRNALTPTGSALKARLQAFVDKHSNKLMLRAEGGYFARQLLS